MKETKKISFSTTELIIVIAVAVVLVAVLVPTFISLANNKKMNEQNGQQISDLATKIDEQKSLSIEEIEAKIAAMIADINIPEGVKAEDVSKAITDAIAGLEIPKGGLSAEEVQAIVNGAIAGLEIPNAGLTEEEVSSIINEALAGVDTGLSAEEVKQIVDEAIAGIEFPKKEITDDVAAATEFNNIVAAANPSNFHDVVLALDAAGYNVKNGIVPFGADRDFFWDPATNTVLLVKNEMNIVYPENATMDNATGWYNLAWTYLFIDSTVGDNLMNFGGNVTLKEDLGLDYNQCGILGDAVLDLNEKVIVIDSNQFNAFADVTIKNGTIHIIGRDCSMNNSPNADGASGSFNLIDVKIEIEAGLKLEIELGTLVNGEEITVDLVKAMCVGDYTITLSTEAAGEYAGCIIISN